jgi:Putative zinc-finger
MEREKLTAALAPGADCLTVEQLGLYVDGAMTGADRAATAAHLRSCVNCRAELALLQSVTSPAVHAGESEIVGTAIPDLAGRAAADARRGDRTPPTWFRFFSAPTPRFPAIVAIVILLIAAVDRLYIRSGRAPSLPASVNTSDDVVRSQTVATRAPIGDQLEPPQRLEWTAVSQASRYRARLMEVDHHEVWSASTTETSIDLPPDVRALSLPSKTLLWDVTAYDATGGQIAESGPQAFKLVPR